MDTHDVTVVGDVIIPCHDIVPLIYALRSKIDLSQPLSQQCEAVLYHLLQLERTYGHCHQLDFFVHLKQLLHDRFIDEASSLHTVDEGGDSAGSSSSSLTTSIEDTRVSIRHYLHRKGIEPIKKLFVSGLEACIQALLVGNDEHHARNNSTSPALLSAEFSSVASHKRRKSASGFYAFNFDDFPMYESIESILSLWGDDCAAVLQKLLAFDVGELVDHPLYEEVLRLLASCINGISALYTLDCTSTELCVTTNRNYVMALSILHRFMTGFGSSVQRMDAINCFLQHLFLQWIPLEIRDDDDSAPVSMHQEEDRPLYQCSKCQLALLVVVLQIYPRVVPLMGASSMKELDRTVFLVMLLLSRGEVVTAASDQGPARTSSVMGVLIQMSEFVDAIVPFISSIRPLSALVFATQSGFLSFIKLKLDGALKQSTIKGDTTDGNRAHRLKSLCLYVQCLSAIVGTFAPNCHLVKASIASQYCFLAADAESEELLRSRRRWTICRLHYPTILSVGTSQRSHRSDYLQPIPHTNKSLFQFATIPMTASGEDADSILDHVYPFRSRSPQSSSSISSDAEAISDAFDKWLQDIVLVVSTLQSEEIVGADTHSCGPSNSSSNSSPNSIILQALVAIASISPSVRSGGFDTDIRRGVVPLGRVVFEQSLAVDAEDFEQSFMAFLRLLLIVIIDCTANMHAAHSDHPCFDPVPVHFMHALSQVLSVLSHTSIGFNSASTNVLMARLDFQRLYSGLLHATAVFLSEACFQDGIDAVLRQTSFPLILLVDCVSKELDVMMHHHHHHHPGLHIDEEAAVVGRYVDCLCLLHSHEGLLCFLMLDGYGRLQAIVDTLLLILLVQAYPSSTMLYRSIVCAVLSITTTAAVQEESSSSFISELFDMSRATATAWSQQLIRLFDREYRDAHVCDHFSSSIHPSSVSSSVSSIHLSSIHPSSAVSSIHPGICADNCDDSPFYEVLHLFNGLLYQGLHREVGSLMSSLWSSVVLNHTHDLINDSASSAHETTRLFQHLPSLLIAIHNDDPILACTTLSSESLYPAIIQMLSVALLDMSFDLEAVRLWKQSTAADEGDLSSDEAVEDEDGVGVDSVFTHMTRRMVNSIILADSRCPLDNSEDVALQALGRCRCRHSVLPFDESELQETIDCMRGGRTRTSLGGFAAGAGSTRRLSVLFAPVNGDGSVSLISILSFITAQLLLLPTPAVAVAIVSQQLEAAPPSTTYDPPLSAALEVSLQDIALFTLPYLTSPSFPPGTLTGLAYQHNADMFKDMVREGVSLLLRDKACIRAFFCCTYECGGSQEQIVRSASVVWFAAACSLLSPDPATLRGVLSLVITHCPSSSAVHDMNGGLIPLTMDLVRRHRGGYIRNVIQLGAGMPILTLLDAVVRHWFFNHLIVRDVLVVTAMTVVHGIKWPALVAAGILLHIADTMMTAAATAMVRGSSSTKATVGTVLSAVRSCGTIDLTSTLLPLMERIVSEEVRRWGL